jgi:hypothetical protein
MYEAIYVVSMQYFHLVVCDQLYAKQYANMGRFKNSR